jgi:hypothetical protein
MMRKAITVMATVLLASALFASQAEAIGRGGLHGGVMSRDGGDYFRANDDGQFGRPNQHARHLESYPSYLPAGSCTDLWYMTGYQSPTDCP